MIEIQLTKGYVAVVDDCDADLAQHCWHSSSGNQHVYAVRNERVEGRHKHQLLHRVILERMIGRPLERYELCDHINHNGLDNTRCNLRLATFSQNFGNQKRPKHNKSGYKGVFFYKRSRKWAARIKVNRKQIYLGLFPTPEAAAEAYKQAAIQYFGEFAHYDDPNTEAK